MMRIFVTLLHLLPLPATAYIQTENCQPPATTETVLKADEFHWNMSLKEISDKESEVYASGKRLYRRAFLKDGQLVLPRSLPGRGEVLVAVPEILVKSVIAQIEKAFAQGYVNALIFPDMGHTHLLVPLAYYNAELKNIKPDQFDVFYQKAFSYPQTKLLYHTAEQLLMVDENKELIKDRHVQWRFFTRNLVAPLDGSGQVDIIHNRDHSHNTARDLDGHHYWGAGFNISGSQKGCFAYTRGKQTMYFDISFEDLPY